MAEDEKKQAGEKDSLIAKACEAYGIGPQYVYSSKISDDGLVTILTNGGTRVRYRKGDKVKPIDDPVKIDGISRKKPKVFMGKKRETQTATSDEQ